MCTDIIANLQAHKKPRNKWIAYVFIKCLNTANQKHQHNNENHCNKLNASLMRKILHRIRNRSGRLENWIFDTLFHVKASKATSHRIQITKSGAAEGATHASRHGVRHHATSEISRCFYRDRLSFIAS